VALACGYQAGLPGQLGDGQFPGDPKSLTDVMVEVLGARIQPRAEALPELIGL
jgi:hypothetical protein